MVKKGVTVPMIDGIEAKPTKSSRDLETILPSTYTLQLPTPHVADSIPAMGSQRHEKFPPELQSLNLLFKQGIQAQDGESDGDPSTV